MNLGAKRRYINTLPFLPLYVYLCAVRAVPGRVADVDVVSLTSNSVSVSWSSLECDQRNGPTVGYSYELTRQRSVHDVETTHAVETSHVDGDIVHHKVTNDTQARLGGLEPFTRYEFAVAFLSADFHGPQTVINLTTAEDGLFHVVFCHRTS